MLNNLHLRSLGAGAGGFTLLQVTPTADTIHNVGGIIITLVTVIAQLVSIFKKKKKTA